MTEGIQKCRTKYSNFMLNKCVIAVKI